METGFNNCRTVELSLRVIKHHEINIYSDAGL